MIWYIVNIVTLFEIGFLIGLYCLSSIAPFIFSIILVLGDIYLDLIKITSDKIKSKMKATLYSHNQGYEVKEIPIPKFTNDEILVQVEASSINPADYKVRIIDYFFLRWFIQPTVGRDFSGKIIELGSNVKDFNIGDEVYGNAYGGALQEYSVVKPNQICFKPAKLNHFQAAAIGLSGLTSLQALTHFEKNLNNKQVLIIGGSGGCGSLGILISNQKSANVHSVCSVNNLSYVKKLGATAYDYNNKVDMENLSKLKFDLIYDTVSSWDDVDGDLTSRYKKLLANDGKYVATNGSKFNVFVAILSAITGIYSLNSDYHLTITNWNRQDLKELSSLAENFGNQLNYKQYKLKTDDIRQAFKELESRRNVGKIVFIH